MGRLVGVIKHWCWKGFGRIFVDDSMADVFFHYSDIQGETHGLRRPTLGATVEFDLTEDARGLRAKNVKVLERAEGTHELPLCPVCNRVMPERLREQAGLTKKSKVYIREKRHEFEVTKGPKGL